MSRRKAKGVPVVQGLLGGDPFILALDVSSTSIGWAFLEGSTLLGVGSVALKGDLLERIVRVEDAFAGILAVSGKPDVLAYEGPAYKAAPMALIAQQRVVGVVLHLWRARFPGRPVLEVAPMEAKVALAGNHRADKDGMIEAARMQAPVFTTLFDEHAADAFGVGLAAAVQLWGARMLAEAGGR